MPARHRDLAGARELANAVAAEEVLERVELALGARCLDRERVLAHVHDVGAEDARDLDDQMADTRRTFGWAKQWQCSIDPETAKSIRDSRAPEYEDSCSMCSKFCAVRNMNKALSGEYIGIR